jgi:geranylgeranyl pyrophosphate synthase
VAAAVALELLHLASLTHDDILDASPLRRGRPTTWGRYGTAVALLAGDHLYGKALAQASLAGRRTCQAFCRLIDALVDGQVLELGGAGRPRGRRAYMTMATAKTAVFCSEASGLGAVLAQAGGRITRALRRFGRLLGQAYQLTDDLLDWRGDPGEMGKHCLQDLAVGNLTFPVLAGLARRPGRVGPAVARVTRASDGEDRGALLVALARELEETGAFEETSLRVRALTDLALESLSALPSGVPRHNLEVLAELMVGRRS